MARPTTEELQRFFSTNDARIHALPLDAGMPALFDPDGSVQAGTEATRWHLIALEGEWSGHYMGPFKLEKEDFEQAKFLFDSMSNELVVDYEHNTYNPFATEAPAAGWIDAMRVSDTDQGVAGLYARIKWTAPAAARIDAREYRYMSPTLMFHTRDRKTGNDIGFSIHSVALTNTPFLDELPEVALSSNWLARLTSRTEPEKNEMNEEQRKRLASLLGLSAEATADEVIAASSRMVTDLAGLERVGNALGLEGASIDAMCATATAIREENDNLRGHQKEAKKLRAKIAVDQARADGKVTASNEKFAIKLAEENPEMFDEWAESAPVVVSASTKKPAGGKKGNGKRDPNLRADEQRLNDAIAEMEPEDYDAAERCGMTPAQWAKANIDELLAE